MNQHGFRYQWEKWFSYTRKQFFLKRGIDYNTNQRSMMQQVRNAAVDRGLRVAIVDTENGLVVTVLEERFQHLTDKAPTTQEEESK